MEKEYEHLMEQLFLLKNYGHLSLHEQNLMNAEDRAWYIDRLNKEEEKKKEAEEKAARGVKTPSMPNIPHK